MVSTPAQLPVTQEAAGSSPVAPAKFLFIHCFVPRTFAAGLVATASVLPSNLPRIATSGPLTSWCFTKRSWGAYTGKCWHKQAVPKFSLQSLPAGAANIQFRCCRQTFPWDYFRVALHSPSIGGQQART